MIKSFKYVLALLLIMNFAISYSKAEEKKINIFTCEPEWAILLQEIVKDKANIDSAIYGNQNPHFIQAKPSLIAKVKNSNMLVCTGAELEIGWLPMLIEKSAYKKSVVYVSNYVKMLDIPSKDEIDRKNGDVHPFGNPHIHLHPENIKAIASALLEKLKEVDSLNYDFYKKNHDEFIKKWDEKILKLKDKYKVLNGVNIVFHHKDFDYLIAWLKINKVAYLEEKAGVSPSAVYLRSIVDKIKNEKTKLIIRAPYSDKDASLFISNKTGIKNIVVPYSMDYDGKNTIFDLYDNILNAIEEGLK
jgi:zinc/manganese transport system substrate-binding protein